MVWWEKETSRHILKSKGTEFELGVEGEMGSANEENRNNPNCFAFSDLTVSRAILPLLFRSRALAPWLGPQAQTFWLTGPRGQQLTVCWILPNRGKEGVETNPSDLISFYLILGVVTRCAVISFFEKTYRVSLLTCHRHGLGPCPHMWCSYSDLFYCLWSSWWNRTDGFKQYDLHTC